MPFSHQKYPDQQKKNLRLIRVLVLLLVCASFSLLFSAIPAWKPVAAIARFLTPFLGPEILNVIIHGIGITGIVFGWLITRTESRICGIAYTKLVEWVFPHLFCGYFFVFIPSYLIGIYASGTPKLFWPTLFAFLEMLCHAFLLVRACLQFVVCPESRERAAFAYYRAQLTECRQQPENVLRNLLNAADYTHMLLRREHRSSCCASMMALWTQSLEPDPFCLAGDWEQTMEQYWKADSAQTENAVLQRIFLCQRVWAALLEGETSPSSRAEVVSPMLAALSADAPPAVRFPILLSLTQLLLNCNPQLSDAVDEIAEYASPVQTPELGKDLAACLAGMLMVHCFFPDDNQARNALWRLRMRFRPQLNALILDRMALRDDQAHPIGFLLLYAEWAERTVLHIGLLPYVLWVDNQMRNLDLKRDALFDMSRPRWHLDMLACRLSAPRPSDARCPVQPSTTCM